MVITGRSGTPAEQTRAGDANRARFTYQSLRRQRRLFQNIAEPVYLLDQGIMQPHPSHLWLLYITPCLHRESTIALAAVLPLPDKKKKARIGML